MKEIILAYQGEMTLKGLNRGKFEAGLAKSIRRRLEDLGSFKVWSAQSTVFIEPQEEGLDTDEAFRRVLRVFGIVKLSRAACCEKDFDAICATAESYLGEQLRGVRTFKVEAKRADKKYPLKSPEICRELGAYLLSRHPHLRVDVHAPQLEVMVEIRDRAAYIHGPKVPAAGGLPVGTSGRALNLLSGGIDSPVAAYCMARRGLALHHIHFASPPYTSLRAKLKVQALACELSEYIGDCVLFVVPNTRSSAAGIHPRPRPRAAVHGAHAPQHAAHREPRCVQNRHGSAHHRRKPRPGRQPDHGGAGLHRRRAGPARAAPAHRHGQGGDRGHLAPHRHV